MLVYKLIVKEFFYPFTIALFSILSILLLGRIVPLLEFFVRSGASLNDLVKTIALFMPLFLQFALPMSGLFGLLISFIKLTQSHEIIGIFAVGVKPKALFMPIFMISLLLFICSLLVSTTLVPHSKYLARSFIRELGENTLYQGLPEGRFVELTKGLVLFANKNKDQGKKLKGVFVWDYREKNTPLMIYAQRGAILNNTNNHSMVLDLKNGIINREGRELDFLDVITFKEYSLIVGLKPMGHKKSRGEMTTRELVWQIKRHDISHQKMIKYVSELIRRYTLPMGTLFLSLLAAPLGIFFGRSGLSTGIALGIAAFLGYYLVTTLSTNLFETGAIKSPAILGAPNVLLFILVLWLWRLLAKRGPVTFI